MPCARRRPLLVVLSGMHATCVVIDEDSGEELEIGSFITSSPNILFLLFLSCPYCDRSNTVFNRLARTSVLH